MVREVIAEQIAGKTCFEARGRKDILINFEAYKEWALSNEAIIKRYNEMARKENGDGKEKGR